MVQIGGRDLSQVEAAIEQCDGILENIEQMPEDQHDFGYSMMQVTEGVKDTIRDRSKVTEAKHEALENMEAAIGKFL